LIQTSHCTVQIVNIRPDDPDHDLSCIRPEARTQVYTAGLLL